MIEGELVLKLIEDELILKREVIVSSSLALVPSNVKNEGLSQ